MWVARSSGEFRCLSHGQERNVPAPEEVPISGIGSLLHGHRPHRVDRRRVPGRDPGGKQPGCDQHPSHEGEDAWVRGGHAEEEGLDEAPGQIREGHPMRRPATIRRAALVTTIHTRSWRGPRAPSGCRSLDSVSRRRTPGRCTVRVTQPGVQEGRKPRRGSPRLAKILASHQCATTSGGRARIGSRWGVWTADHGPRHRPAALVRERTDDQVVVDADDGSTRFWVFELDSPVRKGDTLLKGVEPRPRPFSERATDHQAERSTRRVVARCEGSPFEHA